MKHLCNDLTTTDNRRSLRKTQTDAEQKVWSILRNRQMDDIKFYRQYSVGHYILDFYAPSIRFAIELDGGHHAEEIHKIHDTARSEYIKVQGVQVLRFWNNEVMKNMEGVWEEIHEYTRNCKLNRNSSLPPLNLRGGIH